MKGCQHVSIEYRVDVVTPSTVLRGLRRWPFAPAQKSCPTHPWKCRFMIPEHVVSDASSARLGLAAVAAVPLRVDNREALAFDDDVGDRGIPRPNRAAPGFGTQPKYRLPD